MAKRIYNPVTKKHYAVRDKTTKVGKPGQIAGLWTKETKSKVLMIRMSEGMYNQALQKANGKGMNLQEYIRHLIVKDFESAPYWNE